MSIQPLLVNEYKAADLLDIHVSGLRQDRVDGGLGVPFVNLGKAVRYKLKKLSKFIDARSHAAPREECSLNI
jgi:hypothetical protein